MADPTYRTGLGASDADHIWLLGHDLADDLIGRVTFGELAYWMVTRSLPAPSSQATSESTASAFPLPSVPPTRVQPPTIAFCRAPGCVVRRT